MTLILTILTALLASLFSPGLSAQVRDVPSLGNFRTVTGGPVAAQLAADQAFVAPGKPFTAAVVLSMQPDWHVYWKYPGDSGLPTTVAWDLPPGFTAGPVQWPVPRRFIQDGLVTYGYPGRVLLLAEITPPATLAQDTPVVLRAHAEWLACRVECTPGKADLSLSLPVGSGPPMPDRAWTAAFDDARAHLPSTPDGAVFSASGDEKSITLAVTGPGFAGARFSFYPAADGLKVSAPQEVSGTAGSVRLRLAREPRVKAPDRLTGLLVSDEIGPVGETRAWTVDVPVKPGAAAGMGLISAILLAFIGGVILNLMPCVLPVISLKALALMRHGRDGAARSGLLFTLGVLVSFWVIAAVLEGLRAGGRLLGWGFQFQDPVTVLITAVLFFLIGLNLFGVFEVGSVFGRLAGWVRRGGGGNGGGSAFATGVFATAVATPCTAPFMGAAVGFALSHSVGASLGVFTALGAGMAAPSLALALIPGVAGRLPKPGPWMETFRQVMAFPMMAAAIWMTTVLASLAGVEGTAALLAGMLAAGLGAWIWGRWGTLSRTRTVRVVAGVLAAALIVGSTAAAARVLPAPASSAAATPAAAAATGPWAPWSQERVAGLRSAGTPVFVDFSAKWCLTCVVNERVALENGAVRSRFAEAGIATLRADWTDSNDEIARALASFGRAGVPLYVYYPAGGKDPVVLPEVLTPGIVLAALR